MRPGVAALLAVSQFGCTEVAMLPIGAGMGREPTLPAPKKSFLPTVNIAVALGWPQGVMPIGAANTIVTEFAAGLDHPRWLYVLPNGDILVAETNAPSKPDDINGVRGFFMNLVMKKAGAKTHSANRITLLRDQDGDGRADFTSVFLEGLNSPFGMALIDQKIYVANSNSIVSFPYKEGDLKITDAAAELTKLPAGTINHHWTKNIIASGDGKKLFAAIGSNSNVAERGMDVEKDRACIWEVDLTTGAWRIFADGLRNPVGMAWGGDGNTLFTVVNERDELGSDLVPDYLTSVKENGFYGWPYRYYGQHTDTRAPALPPAKVNQTIVPDYALGPHTASLGLAASKGTTLPAEFASGMFIGQHGSWNRRPHSGYKLIFVPFHQGKPDGEAKDVLTGFLNDQGQAYGRPVGVAMDKAGNLLVADDVGNKIWRVSGVNQ
jgi:glucose/arabinose dehydrogenase